MNELTVGSLFSGIGGFDLGFERAGMRTVWFCEQDDYCRRVLEKHWPGIPCYPDVTELTELEPVDVLCGGFPCQDLSLAGKGAGIDGARSGLWSEFARLIGELRPRYVVVENVPALLSRGIWRVLGDLAEVGYDAEWDCIPASAFGAPHRRDRIWIVAYPNGACDEGDGRPVGDEAEVSGPGDARSDGEPRLGVSESAVVRQEDRASGSEGFAVCDRAGHVADTKSVEEREPSDEAFTVAGSRYSRQEPCSGSWWEVEPGVGRLVDGFPGRLDQLAALGNALVPQIAEWIGRRIVTWEQAQPRQAASSGSSNKAGR